MVVALVGLVGLAGCNDVRDFAGTWHGNRVGEPALRVGPGEQAFLNIEAIDKHGLRATLTMHALGDVPPLISAGFTSIEAAEADALASMTFAGDPLRVYLAFVPLAQAGAGDALAVISLYDADRIELRLLKGEPSPLYAIYPLTRSE